MISLDLGFYRKANVWLDEFPLPYKQVANSFMESLNNGSITSARHFTVTIELIIPAGPRTQYGLLGGAFIPDEENNFLVETFSLTTSKTILEMFNPTLTDFVFFGLLEEYKKAILDEIFLRESLFRAGKLFFPCAAHSLTGSTPNLFRRITRIILEVLYFKTSSAEDIGKIIKAAL